MSAYTAWALGVVALCAAIGVAVWVTGSAWPLLALLLMPSVKKDS